MAYSNAIDKNIASVGDNPKLSCGAGSFKKKNNAIVSVVASIDELLIFCLESHWNPNALCISNFDRRPNMSKAVVEFGNRNGSNLILLFP